MPLVLVLVEAGERGWHQRLRILAKCEYTVFIVNTPTGWCASTCLNDDWPLFIARGCGPSSCTSYHRNQERWPSNSSLREGEAKPDPVQRSPSCARQAYPGYGESGLVIAPHWHLVHVHVHGHGWRLSTRTRLRKTLRVVKVKIIRSELPR